MIRYLFLAGCLCVCLISYGQAPVANFSASVTSGCAPLQVTFSDLSTGNPKFWNWDLGNGQLSGAKNPVAVYTIPGVYTVRLVVRNADGTDGMTKTDYITVNPSPYSDFTSNLNLTCAPSLIQFTDMSMGNGGAINKWQWTFGDGTSSTDRNPAKTYTTPGYYSVSLTVTSVTGCSQTMTKPRFIRVVPGVTADFIDSVPQVCRTPIDLKFLNETSGPGNISYNWNFGNGITSTAEDPVVQFPAAGTFNVRLIANSSLGCGDTTQKTITLSDTLTRFAAPDSACIDQPVSFTNSSSATPVSSSWDFGNGVVAGVLNPVQAFPVAGVYAVKLVNTYRNCTDSIIKNITVLTPPVVDFSADQLISCKAPFTVTFRDNSTDAEEWEWDFGDGTKSTQRNPVHTYTATGIYTVSLTITSTFGCKNILSRAGYINITAPSVSISNAPAGGCIPFTFSPVASVTAVDGVAGYLWNFGNGNTSTLPTPSSTYPNVGIYDLQLTVTTNGGCTATANVPAGIRTGTPPAVDFSFSEAVACAAEQIQFTDLSNPANEWLWNFGDNRTSTEKNPVHAYDSAGIFTVTLTAFNNGCAVTHTKPAIITVTPPVARFDFQADCTDRLAVSFTDLSVKDVTLPLSYEWDFGDPTIPKSNLPNPSVRFSAIGSYTVTLKVSNGSCFSTTSSVVTLSGDRADFSAPDVTVCRDVPFTISAINSNPLNIASYEWTLQGIPAFGGPRSITPALNANGIYDVTLKIIDINGCEDVKTIPSYITVSGPTASFSANKTDACLNTAIAFTDQSTPAPTIRKWTFDFGDGAVQTFTSAPFTHTYSNTGTFAVKLTVEDQQGCTNAFTLPATILITRPQPGFMADHVRSCPGAPVQFTDTSKGQGLSYVWDFGDGNTSSLKNPVHMYNQDNRSYTVKLFITDTSGCVDSVIKVNYISVKSAKAAFTAEDTAAICPPLLTKFNFGGSDYESYVWDFGDGEDSRTLSPDHFYNTYGTFTAKLYVTAFGGCIDSAQQTINVYNPASTTINYAVPPIACNALNVDFTISTPPLTSFTFFFGDGAADASQQKSLKYFYGTPSHQTPYLVLRDSLDCQVTISGTEAIRVIGAEPFYSVDRNKFCDSGTVYFTNFTIGNDPVVSDTWDFGDGVTSTDRDPAHVYTQPGLYLFSHNVETQSGCIKSLTDTIRVYRTPDPAITSDDIVCINSPTTFAGMLAVADTATQWKWNLGNGQTSSNRDVVLAYNRDGTYKVELEATNLLGCKGTTEKTISIVPLPVITVPQHPVITLGTGVKLPVSFSSNVQTYTWTPAAGLDCTTCPVPFASPKFNTVYKVDVVDSNGCANSAEINVAVVCNDKNYFVPNTFSPNGDGKNDVFYPRGQSIDRIQSMKVFNRWGELVFERRNFSVNSQSDGWNGTYKGKPATSDVYVYIIEFICENATIITYKGNVALIR